VLDQGGRPAETTTEIPADVLFLIVLLVIVGLTRRP